MWPLVSTYDRQTTGSSICVATSDSFDLHMTQHIFADCLQPALHRTDRRLPPDAYVITKGLCSGCRVGGDKDGGGRGVRLAVAEGTAFRQRVQKCGGPEAEPLSEPQGGPAWLGAVVLAQTTRGLLHYWTFAGGQAPHLLLTQGREAVPGALSNTCWIYRN